MHRYVHRLLRYGNGRGSHGERVWKDGGGVPKKWRHGLERLGSGSGVSERVRQGEIETR